jgi:hypothetical protein
MHGLPCPLAYKPHAIVAADTSCQATRAHDRLPVASCLIRWRRTAPRWHRGVDWRRQYAQDGAEAVKPRVLSAMARAACR